MNELLSITVQGPLGRITYRTSRKGVRIHTRGTPPRESLARIAQVVSDLTTPVAASRADWEVVDG